MNVTVSTISGGESAANLPLLRALRALARQAKSESEHFANCEDRSSLDITFKVSGPIVAADFEGVRFVKWSPKRSLFVVQVGVQDPIPLEIVNEYLRSTLDEVGHILNDVVVRKKINIQIAAAHSLLQSLATSL